MKQSTLNKSWQNLLYRQTGRQAERDRHILFETSCFFLSLYGGTTLNRNYWLFVLLDRWSLYGVKYGHYKVMATIWRLIQVEHKVWLYNDFIVAFFLIISVFRKILYENVMFLFHVLEVIWNTSSSQPW